MDINSLYKEAEKIVPLKRLLIYFLILFVIGLLIVFSKLLGSELPNRDFFEAELNGKVHEIKSESKNNYFHIGTNWYLIKNECIVYISKGDSLNKPKNSYELKVYDKQSNIKWQGEVKRLIFKKENMLLD